MGRDQFIEMYSETVVPLYLLYYLDFSPCDYFLYVLMKGSFGVEGFEGNEAVDKPLQTIF